MTRLIDTNELMEWVKNWQKMDDYYHSDEKRNDIPISELGDIIDRMPTVDAVPVRHGRWIAHTMSEITGYDPALSGDDPVCSYSCSVCGEDCYVSDTGDDILSDFCPNCGARMDEE